jgi:signal transduction histidine kinase/DNA-binding response OmpR family regulator
MATILVVDDHPINRNFWVTLLGYQGHSMQEASDGAEALGMARTVHPDLIISDILMPTMDGYEFVRQLRADPTLAYTPVIFSTAHYLDREAEALAQKCGVHYILPKPCEPEVILRIVNAALSLTPTHEPPSQEESFDREHLQLLTDQLALKVVEVQALNEKLGALIELGQHLVSEHDLPQLLEVYGRGARQIVGASWALIGIFNEATTGLEHTFSSGLGRDTIESLSHLTATQGVLGEVIRKSCPYRFQSVSGQPDLVGLPRQFPPIYSFLGVPISHRGCVYGWLGLGNKLGGNEFSEADEQLAITLCAQLAITHQNMSLFRRVQSQAETLTAEMVERQRAEDEVRSLNTNLERHVHERTAELEVANQELEAFNTSVSHDLYAPLRSIDGFSAALLEEYGDRLDSQGHDYLRRVRQAAQHMTQLIHDLLSLSQVARRDLEREAVDLSRLAGMIVAELRCTQPDRQVSFRMASQLLAQGDARLLRIALENLLGNAWKFTGRQPHARIEFGVSEVQGRLAFFIRDNGAGFDMTYVGRLFSPFNRLHSATDFAGTGIGLATVQRIIRRHGGRIWAEGSVGQGATFYFTLPEAELHPPSP